MISNVEQSLESHIAANEALIRSKIGYIREWMKLQSEADMDNMGLSAVQRAMATRIFKRATHTGSKEEQATDLELDSYYCDAEVLRDLVPAEVATVHKDIEVAANDVIKIRMYMALTPEEKAQLAAS